MAGGNIGLGHEVINSDNKLNQRKMAVNIVETAISIDEQDSQRIQRRVEERLRYTLYLIPYQH